MSHVAHPWAEWAIDGLFGINLAAVGAYVFLSRHHPVRFVLAILIGAAELVAAASIWFFGGMSVSGFYF